VTLANEMQATRCTYTWHMSLLCTIHTHTVVHIQAVQSLYGPLQRISYVHPEFVLEVVLPVLGSQNPLVQVVAQAACTGIAATAHFAQVDSDNTYASNSTQQVYAIQSCTDELFLKTSMFSISVGEYTTVSFARCAHL
jgi:hypothetical protein